MIHIGCGTVCFRKLPLDEALRRIAQAGYEYVEPQATAPFCPHVDPWRDDPQQFQRRVAELGFRGASALWAPNGAIIRDPDSVRGVSQAVRWAHAAGIPVVNCGDGAKPAGMSDADALACLGDRLAQILAVAEMCQVHVAIEPHGAFSLTAEGLKKILGLSSSPWLGVNYDAANVRRATYVETVAGAYSWTPFGQRQDEVATLGDVVGRVVHFHAKDLCDGKCVALGDGDVKNEECIALLAKQGYAGVLSLETEGEGTPEECQQLVERSRQYLLHQVSRFQAV
jgi:sugar phosphate isomerase/epimerase